MDAIVNQRILQDRQIAYAIIDRNLQVTKMGGAVSALSQNDDLQPFLGMSIWDLAPELIGNESELKAILTGQLPRLQLNLINRETPAGDITYFNLTFLPHRNEQKQISGILYLLENVTDIGRLKQNLVQQRNELRLLRDQLAQQNLNLAAANAELQKLDEMKSTFVSVAAHELRTPLTAIKGYVEMLLDEDEDPLSETQYQYLEVVQRGTERLLIITNNMLDANRIESERIDLILQPTDLSALIETVITEFAPVLEAKDQRLTLWIQPALPLALCNDTRSAQILSNLLSNASKYTPEAGEITISLLLAEAEGFLQVSITDNGVGIPLKDRAKLFTRFFRAGNANETGASGAGLGLYITRSLIEQQGGQIWFESKPGQGTTFHVTFPIADEPVPTSNEAPTLTSP